MRKILKGPDEDEDGVVHLFWTEDDKIWHSKSLDGGDTWITSQLIFKFGVADE